MSIRDFVKKHKKKLIVASGILGSLLALNFEKNRRRAMNAAAEQRDREAEVEGARNAFIAMVERDAARDAAAIAAQRNAAAVAAPVEHVVRERRHSEPSWQLVPFRHRRVQSLGWGHGGSELSDKPQSLVKNNSLLKAVQAYRKKHGVSLKEAWAAVR